MPENVFGNSGEVPEKQSKVIEILINRLREELGLDVSLHETPDTFEIVLRDANGSERKEVFTKMCGKLPVGESWYPVEKVIEARLRYPEEKLSEALKKLEK